ncbi:MAG: T9SS type A sorting domain-containing protein [Chlorobi bacterium]|nr:T9SS type A sorting domain-containing protein [Chlorobiota bacterium]
MSKIKITGYFVFLILFLGFSAVSFGTGVHKNNKNRKGNNTVTGANPKSSVISVNNITCWVGDDGFHDWVVGGGSWNGAYPNGAGAGAIFSEGIVWGGKVSDGQTPEVRVNGNTYGTGCKAITRIFRVRPDYKRGNLTSDAAAFFKKSIDKVTDAEVQQIRDQYEKDWYEWPVQEGALYDDVDGDGEYDPDIDEPGVPGASQTIFIKYDDSFSASNYGSPPIGLEVSETYWAYSYAGPLGNVIYKKVDIVYKGTNNSSANSQIDSLYIVQWADPDVGNAGDDFAGCDTTLNFGYAYTSKNSDAIYDGIGIAPPAVGYDFLQGVSRYTGNPNDSAMFDLKWRKGYKYLNRKPMSSFIYFAAGGSWSDPSFDYQGTLEFYNLMRGVKPQGGYPNSDPFPTTVADVTADGTFLLAGDPVTGTGKIDGSVDGPGDRRIMVVNGPINDFMLGDTAQVVIALVGGLGNSNLNSITQAKTNDATAQLIFDKLFQLPSINPPKVDVVNLHNQVVLNWGDEYNLDNIETYSDLGYLFEGYEVYQLADPSASLADGKLLATFDIANGVTVVYDNIADENGVQVPIKVADGSDSGIQRFLEVNKDLFRQTDLRDGQTYYFAVVSYAYNENPALPFHILRSPLVVLSALPQEPPIGERYETSYGAAISAEHIDGVSNGSVTAKIIDPSQLTGDTYVVTFREVDTLAMDTDTLYNVTVWDLENTTQNVVKLSNQLNQNADSASPIVDGVQYLVSTEPVNEFKDFSVTANESGVLDPPNGGAVSAVDFPSAPITDAQQVGMGHWAIHTNEFNPADPTRPILRTYFEDFLKNVLLDDDSLRFFPYDWEMRFTDEGSWAVRVTDGSVYKVPFELWNTGINTPDDPSDDYRLIPWIFDVDNDGTYNLSSPDHSCTPDTTDWYTDIVTWRIPEDNSAGQAGYQAFVEAIDTVAGNWGSYDFLGSEAIANTVLVNLSAGVIPNQALPETGTIFRIETTKWNTPSDKFTLTLPKVDYSDAAAKEDVKKINVFPNPYYGYQSRELSRDNHYVTFNHLPAYDATIRIFDLSGVLVKTIKHNATSGQFNTWNLQNESNLPVASGIYIVYIEIPKLGKTKILKLAVVQEQQILKVY